MAIAIKKTTDSNVAPHWHAHAKEIQKYGSVIEDMPHPLSAKVRADMTAGFARVDQEFAKVHGDINLLRWMAGANFAITLAVFVKFFIH